MPYEVLDSGSGRYEVLGDAPAAVKAGAELNSIPRQLGLTARYGLEGLANTAQVFTEPLRYLTDKLVPDRAPTMGQLVTGERTPKSLPLGVIASNFADSLGLPKPETANERVIGDASRLMAGAGGMGVLAGAPVQLGRTVSQLLPSTPLAQNMAGQITSAAGAGLAGGASREAGGSPLMQGAAAFAGGLGGGSVPGVLSGTLDKAKSLFARMSPQDIDLRISAILQGQGVDYSALPATARNSLRQDLASMLQAGQEVNPEAVRRLADFRAVGATPTRGMVTQNPVQITREQNLAKIGANTADEGLQGLAQLQNRNNATFIDNLNQQGAARGNLQTVGERVNGAILGRQADLRGAERSAWESARQAPGYRQPIEAGVISDINRALGDEGQMPFLNPTISRYMEAFQTGQQPFTPQAYRNLQSMLSNELSRGGNEAAAAGLARRVLEQSELRPITNPRGIDFGNMPVTADTAARLRTMDAAPGQAIDAVNQARAATRAAYAYEDSSPLVRSVLSDGANGDPMRIAKRFVVGGTPNEAGMLAQEVGEAGRGQIRDALVAHLKEKALSGAADEVGKFSQAAYNKALREIGDRKLALFFSPEEIAQLNSLGRVASYATVQPVGSAVNNSNSGALMVGKVLDGLAHVGRSIPVIGPMAVQPVANGINGLNIALRTRQAQNVAPGLLASTPKDPAGMGLLLPALPYSGGLLSAP
jgi:hypothetical protein